MNTSKYPVQVGVFQLLVSIQQINSNTSNSQHRRYHNKPQRCHLCKRGFGTKKDLGRHINDVHLRTEKYYCSVAGCKYAERSDGIGKHFSRKDNWKRHMTSMHNPTAGKEKEVVESDTTRGMVREDGEIDIARVLE